MYAQQTVGCLAAGMAEVRRPQWVSDLIPAPEEAAWRLMGKGRDQGLFDAVVGAWRCWLTRRGLLLRAIELPASLPMLPFDASLSYGGLLLSELCQHEHRSSQLGSTAT